MATKTTTTTMAGTVAKIFKPRQCAYGLCKEVFTPTRESQIYHPGGDCSAKARQERYWKKYRPVLKKAQKAEAAKRKKNSSV